MSGLAKIADHRITQICYLTDDLEASAQLLEKILGVSRGPVHVAADPVTTVTTYLGEGSRIGARTSAFDLGNIVLELLEPGPEPSTWREYLRTRGPGVHHIAFRSDDLVASRSSMDRAGLPTLQAADFNGGGGRYAVFDTIGQLGTFLELFELLPSRAAPSNEVES
jgi:4-hydroxyphenylpyruvate dioxygenase-like putative hemolysin